MSPSGSPSEQFAKGNPNALFHIAAYHASGIPLSVDSGSAAEARRRRLADQAMQALSHAVELGFKDHAKLRTERDFDPLRPQRDFQMLMMDLAFPADPFARP